MRKHHNKLYYSKYRYKTIFKLPNSLCFYPTTDQYLQDLIEKNFEPAKNLTLEELIALSNELAQGILNDLISQGEDKVLEKKEELIDIIKEYKIPYSYKIVDPIITLQIGQIN